LTRASIDLLLSNLDQATRQKDVDGVLRHIAADVTVTIHMRQGAHQQSAMLTREEYRKTLAMEFAFPSANDFTRVNTTVSLAPDERSAKVSYKSTQTLRQSNRELKIEGEETFVVRMLGSKPTIVSLEKVVPGDSM
jgi:ketosteroid isomerase-like protein